MHVAPDAAERLDTLREALPDGAAASAWNGMLVARIVAADGACLRAAIVAGLASLRGGRPLPRVWTC
jgi:urease accessory protein